MYYFLLEKKGGGMGWVKYIVLEDQERPFMFKNVLKVCLEIS
jgi:hypothetical protein